MDMMELITSAGTTLKRIDARQEEVAQEQSQTDLALSDILHFLEEAEHLHPTRDWKVVKELVRLRKKRKGLQQEWWAYKEFNSVRHKFLNPGFIDTSLQTIVNEYTGEPYKNRVYDNVRDLSPIVNKRVKAFKERLEVKK